MRSERCGGGEAVGETQKRPFQLSFNSSLKGRFPKFTGDLGWWIGTGARAGRAFAHERTRGPALERFAPGQEYPIASSRPAAAIDIQPIGGV